MKQNLRKNKTMALASMPSVSPSVPMTDITLWHSLPLALGLLSELQQNCGAWNE